jgi:hypothetical protein
LSWDWQTNQLGWGSFTGAAMQQLLLATSTPGHLSNSIFSSPFNVKEVVMLLFPLL